MVEIADIFRIHGPEYRSQFRDRMPPPHLRTMDAIEHCRTEALGGQLYFCEQCKERHYSYHSCKNRHCPKRQNDQANEWLNNQKNLLLPVNYFMVTFTLPEALRSPARSHQKLIYNFLFRASSEALLELASDPRFVGAKIGAVGILHTWTRELFTILTFTTSSPEADCAPMAAGELHGRISSFTSSRSRSSSAPSSGTCSNRAISSISLISRSGAKIGSLTRSLYAQAPPPSNTSLLTSFASPSAIAGSSPSRMAR